MSETTGQIKALAAITRTLILELAAERDADARTFVERLEQIAHREMREGNADVILSGEPTEMAGAADAMSMVFRSLALFAEARAAAIRSER